jgi:hypothetical protein
MRFGFPAARKQSQLVSGFHIILPTPYPEIHTESFDVDVDDNE